MPRNRISGAQPTFSTLGKAKGSKTGNKRAKAGQRVTRRDAFPHDDDDDEGGRKLVDSPNEDEDGYERDEGEPSSRVSKKRRAGSGAARNARVTAAEKRASYPPRMRGRSPDPMSSWVPSDFSYHTSDDEPDSDDPDRESDRARRWREACRRRDPAWPNENPGGGGGGGEEEDRALDEMRRIRAEAAEKRRVESTTIVLDGQETDEEREYQASKVLKSARSEQARGNRVAQEGPAQKQHEGEVSDGARRRRGGPTEAERWARLEQDVADMPPARRSKELERAANKLGIAPRASTSRQSPDGPDSHPRRSRRRSQELFIARSATEDENDDDGGDDDSATGDPFVPAFVDPRRDLARRKARQLSDPPTDAFSSSGGSSDEAASEGGGEGDSARASGVDEFDRIEREMKKRKREYRDERRPGYSNPRKN